MSPTSSSTSFLQARHRLDLNSVRVLVFSVNQHFDLFLLDSDARKCIQLSCYSKLKAQKQEFFEFSELSVLSNLYWGIDNFEAAVKAQCEDESSSLLKSSEHMLQVPALLDEHGSTSGVSNRFLVCCAYFYLSIIRKLQNDEWQMALHVLHAILVSPRLVRTHFAPEIWEFLFLSHIIVENEEENLADFCEEAIDDVTRELARRYKDWMMYYQVVLHRETPGLQWLPKQGLAAAYNYKSELWNHPYRRCLSAKCVETNKQVILCSAFDDVMVEDPLKFHKSLRKEIRDEVKAPGVNFVNKFSIANDEDKMSLKYSYLEDNPVDEKLSTKCLHHVQKGPESDTSISLCSHVASAEGSDSEEMYHDNNGKVKISTTYPEILGSQLCDGKLLLSDISSPEDIEVPIHGENASSIFSSKSLSSTENTNLNTLELSDIDLESSCNGNVVDVATPQKSVKHAEFGKQGSLKNRSKAGNEADRMKGFEKAVSTLYYSDTNSEISSVWEILRTKTDSRYEILKGVILDQLLNVISTSKEDELISASVSVLLVLISENRSIIDDIMKKKTCLYDLASVLKRGVHDSAVLIYLLNPSPAELNKLGILHYLMEIVSSAEQRKAGIIPSSLTPMKASIEMIEVLVTKSDFTTNCKNLSVISSQEFLSVLLKATRYTNMEEGASAANILVMCMRYDGSCRSYISEAAPVADLLHLLISNDRQAKFTSLELFHEMLRVPRASATNLLHQIRLAGKINIMHSLMAFIQQAQLENRIIAANLLLQLDAMEDTGSRSIFREEAVEVLVESLSSERNPDMQILSAFVLSNLGGTFAKTGEPCTAAWLLRKMGFSSLYHMNMIKNYDWSDPTLQDTGTDAWCSKVGRSLLKIGDLVFQALEKGLESTIRSVSRDCLVAIAWIGCEIAAMSKTNFTYTAPNTLLNSLVRSLSPGFELEERLLACICLYNYTLGRGIQNVINITEGLRESLRRLSSITWMAEELLKVADSVLPRKSHISCVHTQILEAGHSGNGAVTSLIYFRGQLYSGYSDGSIKIWDIKDQSAKLVREIKAHRKKITCFALFEPGDSLLTGSADKTIKIWKMIQRKLETVDTVEMKEPILKMETHGQQIYVITHGHGLKVCDGSRHIKTICQSKRFKCIAMDQGRVYLGCTDSSIQEVDLASERMKELKSPEKCWWMRRRPIYSISLYKESMYSGADSVQRSDSKEQRRHNGTIFSTAVLKRRKILALEAVEDFLYFNSSCSPNVIQIWLRGNRRKVGRLSAGSRITSLLTANDIVLCGTEAGVIKGWVPL